MAITVKSVRFWIADRTPADNPLLGDLEYTDEDIVTAMGHAAREFNSIPPVAYKVDPTRLPDDTNLFYEAIAEILYRQSLHKLMRNHFTYEGGNVKVDESGPRINGFQELLKLVSGWRQTAQELKHRINTPRFYARLG